MYIHTAEPEPVPRILLSPREVLEKDKRLGISVLSSTPNPQQIVWLGMHQCYCSDSVYLNYEQKRTPSEEKSGETIVKNLLGGNRGHYSPLEHAKFVFNVYGFPHSVMQQLRTHRVGVSFSVQSGRYTGQSFLKVPYATYNHRELTEDAYYLRPTGWYHDRNGKPYFYSEEERTQDLIACEESCWVYRDKVELFGQAEEHARRVLFWDIVRQHFVFSGNARSLMHILDLRSKKDAQLEIQALSWLMFDFFHSWMPQVAKYYEEKRLGKAKLAP